MDSKAALILSIAGLTALILLIRYIVAVAVNKGADAINNAIVDKKNRDAPSSSENLADRFNQQSDRRG